MNHTLIKAARKYYSARGAAEKYYALSRGKLSDLMRRANYNGEYRKISEKYRRLKMKQIEAWERYWPLLDRYGWEYENMMKSILRHI